jgi:transposase InsO family protein
VKNQYSIGELCQALEVSRSGYHAWANGTRGKRERSDAQLVPVMRQCFEQSRQSYGYPRMTVELRSRGLRAGKTRVARLMRENALQGRARKRYVPRTTQSDHDGPIAPNHLATRAPTSACDQVWQTDITYIPTAEGWLYLAVVLDAHSRRILGYAFSETLETDFVIKALLMAVILRGGKLAAGLLLHSDRGVQYSSQRFRAQLAAHGMLPSMSRRGNCYDYRAKRQSDTPRPSRSSQRSRLNWSTGSVLKRASKPGWPSSNGSRRTTTCAAAIPQSDTFLPLTSKT